MKVRTTIVTTAVLLMSFSRIGAEMPKPFLKLKGHTDDVLGLAFSSDGKKLASGGSDGTIRIWNLATGKETHKFDEKPNEVAPLGFSTDGKTLISYSWRFDGHNSYPTQVTWRDLTTGRRIRRLSFPDGMGGMILSPDRKTLIICGAHLGNAKIYLHDAKTGKLERTLETNDFTATLAFSPDSKRLAVVEWRKGITKIWDLSKNKIVKEIKPVTVGAGRFDSQFGVAFSPDGKNLAGVCGNGSIIHDLQDKDPPIISSYSVNMHGCIRYVDGGKVLLLGLGGGVHAINTKTGKKVVAPFGIGKHFVCFEVSPDGKTLATGCNEDFEVELWKLQSWIRQEKSRGEECGNGPTEREGDD
jgi:WD40 repeat protein